MGRESVASLLGVGWPPRRNEKLSVYDQAQPASTRHRSEMLRGNMHLPSMGLPYNASLRSSVGLPLTC